MSRRRFPGPVSDPRLELTLAAVDRLQRVSLRTWLIAGLMLLLLLGLLLWGAVVALRYATQQAPALLEAAGGAVSAVAGGAVPAGDAPPAGTATHEAATQEAAGQEAAALAAHAQAALAPWVAGPLEEVAATAEQWVPGAGERLRALLPAAPAAASPQETAEP